MLGNVLELPDQLDFLAGLGPLGLSGPWRFGCSLASRRLTYLTAGVTVGY